MKLETEHKALVLFSPGATGSSRFHIISISHSEEYVNNFLKHLSCDLWSLITPH